jgi:hypothetical protein
VAVCDRVALGSRHVLESAACWHLASGFCLLPCPPVPSRYIYMPAPCRKPVGTSQASPHVLHGTCNQGMCVTTCRSVTAAVTLSCLGRCSVKLSNVLPDTAPQGTKAFCTGCRSRLLVFVQVLCTTMMFCAAAAWFASCRLLSYAAMW